MSVLDPTTQQLFAKVDEIANGIAQSEAASMYWQARDKMMRHQEAQGLFDDLKKKTNGLLVLKDRVGEQSDKYQRVKEQAELIEARLAEIPVALQYKAAQDELNAMLQEVMLVLLAHLKTEVPVEQGPRSCGSGGSCSTGGGCSCSAH
ncbi:YlbF family regulator [Alicyclobacillus fastidiosus]|uniref:YlbF family regulator n=1 Tax=Alicyclobacillus fastidiosus TaxID=392011 RepID=A0ABY6ZBB3_9BACL|nr:YlbF family regulator [Alicyclobacillus fastidiosus]WAH40127.1 YlbF family regulator [Alicyclobacillus fastidiosus]GMA61466.1 hypothetical protein GCM10025859_19060 [Alicyclobacillus fastidiosus]